MQLNLDLYQIVPDNPSNFNVRNVSNIYTFMPLELCVSEQQ